MSEPLTWTLCEAAEAVATRRISARELTGAAIARAEAVQPTINAFIHLDREAALTQADAVDKAIAAGETVGPLAGVPLAHKDMLYRPGRVSTCGSSIRREFVPQTLSTVLARLDTAGAVDLGGLNMSEFAVGPTGHNVHWGHCRNPWSPEFMTGGSSTGSGAATAARAVFGAIGSDTGGSIRLPAAACGLYGIKPTQTRVSRYGAMGLSFSLDTLGPLTRTARDCARIFDAIAGHDPHDPTSSRRPTDAYEAATQAPARGMRIGVPKVLDYAHLSPEIADLLAASRKAMTDAGFELVEIDLPELEPIRELFAVVLGAESAAVHASWLRTRPADYAPQVRARLSIGLSVPATRYLEAMQVRGRVVADFVRRAFADCDAIQLPAIPFPLRTLEEIDVGASAEMAALIGGITHFTRPINYLGLPALTVPMGFTGNGLPAAFQFVGRPFAEATLFRAAAGYEAATDWTTRAPKL